MAKCSGSAPGRARAEAILFIISRMLEGEADIRSLKHEASRRFRPVSFLRNPEILAAFPKERLTPEIRELLVKKPTKTLSGVTPVAVMILPQGSCRHGCIYCPAAGLAPKSYTGFEPAALRGRQYGFDPFLQAQSRVRQFEEGGHPTDKCEVIIMGGTFLQTSPGYKEGFIKGVYEGLNGFRSASLEEAKSANEKAQKHRVIGLTIETRPDVCVPHIDEMLSYGATRVELGVQHPDDDIYLSIKRGHTVADVADATLRLKDAAFKVLYHIMPGLPGSDREKDISFTKRLFEDERFKPDMLKIYPTLIIGGTELERWSKEGRFVPYTTEEAAEAISEMYRHIPKYVRVMRIQRDIPAQKIEGGVRSGNLRELVEAKLREKGIEPKEIRYREIGLQMNRPYRGVPGLSVFKIERMDYDASKGKEIFLSSENEEGLIAGFIRVRMPGSDAALGPDVALVRELHVYGSEAPISEEGKVQHKGLGAKLLCEAEEIARAQGRERMLIISGVGVRDYYRRHGYSLVGPYMGKAL
jgi:elongator complex protein 3